MSVDALCLFVCSGEEGLFVCGSGDDGVEVCLGVFCRSPLV